MKTLFQNKTHGSRVWAAALNSVESCDVPEVNPSLLILLSVSTTSLPVAT